MNSRDFVYWLRGYLEHSDSSGVTASQMRTINNHLALAIQTEADAKRLSEDYDRARIAKMLSEAGANDIAYGMSQRHPPAGC